MNDRERAFFTDRLDTEREIIERLERQYRLSLAEIDKKILLLQSNPMTQSRMHQVQYQETLRKQIEAVLDKLHKEEYKTLDAYLHDSYTAGFVGTMHSLHGQGLPVIAPIDQNAAVKAILTDSKLSEPLYESLGLDVQKMKRAIRLEITRGVTTGLPYDEIARNIQSCTDAPLNRARTIAMTEGHRIQEASGYDAALAAKQRGCDLVKQWDATLDSKTRESHRRLDGQVRELDEPFEVDGYKAMYPGGFGVASQDVKCRCVTLKRARWALDASELERMKERAKFFELDKAKDFEAFMKKYLQAADIFANPPIRDIIVSDKQFGKKIGRHAEDYGFDPGDSEGRRFILNRIQEIHDRPDETAIGFWRGQEKDVVFYIQGDDVVITKQSGEFVTIMKDGVNNERVKNARRGKV